MWSDQMKAAPPNTNDLSAYNKDVKFIAVVKYPFSKKHVPLPQPSRDLVNYQKD